MKNKKNKKKYFSDCVMCKKRFERERYWQRFCSVLCRGEWHNIRAIVSREMPDDVVNKYIEKHTSEQNV